MAEYGGKVTRLGADVSSTDLRDFVLHSGYKNLKCQARAQGTLLWPGGAFTASTSIPHGLGYVPMFFVMMKGAGSKWYNIVSVQGLMLTTGSKYGLIAAYADATNLTVAGYSVDPPPADTNLIFSYFVIIDEF